MSNRTNLGTVIGIIAFIVSLAAVELLVRSSETSRHIAGYPVEMVNADILSAKLNALEGLDRPTAVLVGDSVAFGEIMSDYGVKAWRKQELSAKLNERLFAKGTDLRVTNFASNGLTPADSAVIIERAVKAGADAVILIVGLRGFSESFESADDQYSYDWGRSGAERPVFAAINRGWKTKPAMEFGLNALAGGPFRQVITRVREKCYARVCEDKTLDTFQVLQMKRRLAAMSLAPEAGFQAAELSSTLRDLDTAGIPTIIVYATENPAVVSSFISEDRLVGARAALRALVGSSGASHIYLPADPLLTRNLYVDHMHLTPDGYDRMAERIAPLLIEAYR